MDKIKIISTLILLTAGQLFGQCRQNSIGPRDIEFVSLHPDNSIYFNFTDFIQIKYPMCVDYKLLKSIKVTAKTNCTIDKIVLPYEGSIIETSKYHIKALTHAPCVITVIINDTITKTFTYYPKTIPSTHVDASADEITFINSMTENNVIGDPSCGVIYWTPIKYSICIIDNGKMLYSGQNIGADVKQEIKTAIMNAPKNSYILFYDITLESQPSMCLLKEKYSFDYASTKKH
jgi:hypothetical protein